jgi:hypothetical protein
VLAVPGIAAGRAPVIAPIARTAAREGHGAWPMAKRLYRSCANRRVGHRDRLNRLDAIARRAVRDGPASRLLVAVDPMDSEKPSTATLEGVSTASKSTPPGPRGERRLTAG